MIVVVQALPVVPELLQARLVDVLNAVALLVSRSVQYPYMPRIQRYRGQGRARKSSKMVDVHTPGAPGHPPAFLQAVELALAGVLGLALHEVIVVLAASGADKKGGREERRRADSELLYLGDRVRKRGGVVEDLLVETGEER